MNTILVIDSAVSGDASVSKALVREAVAALTDRERRPTSSTATSAATRCRT